MSEPEDILRQQATDAMRLALGAQLVVVLSAEVRTQQFVAQVTADGANGETTRAYTKAVMVDEPTATTIWFSMQKEAALLNAVLRSGEPIHERPVAKIAALKGGGLLAYGADAIGAQFASLLPMLDDGKHLGLVVVYWATQPERGVDTRELAQVFVRQLISVASTFQQVNELRRREAQARNSVKFYETVVNISGSGMFLLDSEDKVIFANKHIKRMLGYTDAELLSRPLRDLFHLRTRGDDAQAVTMGEGGTVSFENYLIRSDDDALPVMMSYVPPPDSDGSIANVVVVTDLTELKDREVALMRRTRQLSAINEAARVIAASLDYVTIPKTILAQSVQVVNAEAGSITLVDEDTGDLVFRAVVGPGSEGILGLRIPVGQGVVGYIAQTGEPTLVPDIRKDKRFYSDVDATTGLVTRSLIGVPLQVKRRVIGVLEVLNKQVGEFDEDDLNLMMALAQWAAVAIDNARLYNDLRNRARQLEVVNQELREADRLKDEMIQNVSHELRTPLMHINGYLDMILSGYFGDLSSDMSESMVVVRRKTDVLNRLISDIVSLQKMSEQALERNPVQLATVATQALRGVKLTADEARCTLRLAAGKELALVYADEDRVEQVLDNLLVNAIKFSPNGGQIEVRLTEKGDYVQVMVSDQGIGIPKQHQARIFQRFFQGDGSTTRRFGGLGLGLAICDEIVRAHGGDIWVESETGRGTRMFFTLPKANTPAATAGAKPPRPRATGPLPPPPDAQGGGGGRRTPAVSPFSNE